MPKKKKKICADDVAQWMGTDSTIEVYQEIIADIANGSYDPKVLLEDIKDTCDL